MTTVFRFGAVAALAASVLCTTAASYSQHRPTYVPPSQGGQYGVCANEASAGARLLPSALPGSNPSLALPHGPTWQTSTGAAWDSPGESGPGTIRLDTRVELGLRDKFGASLRAVTVTVYGPNDEEWTRPSSVFSDDWTHVYFPSVSYTGQMFGPPTLAPGVYTVTWHDTGTGMFIACSGFEVTT